jgi:hypothetical protein
MRSRLWLSLIFLSTIPLRGLTPGDFTIVVLPDSQIYSKSYPQIFDSQAQWIASNAAAQNIKLVISVGDTVNTATDATQWGRAMHSIGILDQANVPYALAIGNHDYDSVPPTSRKATQFNQYLGPLRYSGKPYYSAANYPSGSNENFYETFTWGNKSYLILVLEFVPRSGAVAWAKSVLSSNTDKEIIVVTHSYLFNDGTTVDQCDTADMVGDNNGAMLWSNLLSQYANVSVVVSGHITNTFSARRSDVGVNGNFVHQFFANWQDWTNGGNGYFRIMRFSPANNSIQVQSYSPYTNLYLTDPANQFTVKWHKDASPTTGVAKITGRVRTSGYGANCKPIAGATVNVGGATARSDANGYYALTFSPGQVPASSAAAGYKTATQTAALNDYFSNQLDFFLAPTPPCPQSATDPSVTICAPKSGATVSSPVTIVAGTNSSAPLVSLAIWVDGKKVFNTGQALLNTSVPLLPGTHQVSVQGINGLKQVFTQTIYVNVNSTTPPCALSSADPSVTICTPAPNATVKSPVAIVAGSRDSSAAVTNMFIWVDGVKQWTGSGGTVQTALSMAPGTRRVTVQAKDAVGRYFQSTVYVTVQ